MSPGDWAREKIDEIQERLDRIIALISAPTWSSDLRPDRPGWWRFRNLSLNLARNVSEVRWWDGRLRVIFGPNTRIYVDDLAPEWECGGEVTNWPLEGS